MYVFGVLILVVGIAVAWCVDSERIKNTWAYQLIVLFLTKIK